MMPPTSWAAPDAPTAAPAWTIAAASWAGWPDRHPPNLALVGEDLTSLGDVVDGDLQRRLVIVVEDPAAMAALHLHADGEAGVAAKLGDWQRAAHRLLRLLRLHRARCLAVHTDDIRRAPAAVGERLTEAGVPNALQRLVLGVVPIDVITLAFGQALVAAMPTVTRLNAELRASCDAIDGAPIGPDATALDAALAQLRSLQNEARRAAELDAQRVEWQRRAHQDSLRLRDAERERRRLAAMTEELDAALVQGDLLAADRRSLQDALARETDARRLAEREQEEFRARTRRQIEMLQEERAAGVAQQRRLEQALAATDSARASLAARVDALAPLASRVNDLASRVDDLAPLDTRFRLSHAGAGHQVQMVPSEFPGSAGAAVAALRGRVGGVVLGMANGGGEHLGFDLDLLGLSAGQHQVDLVQIRLVEHLGHPGLLFFAAANGTAPLSQWQANGEEDGRPFMLLIPDESAHRSILLHLGSTDWVTVLLAATAAELAFAAGDGGAAGGAWQQRAARLRRALEDLPMRLRYDDLLITATPGQQTAHFVRPLWGAQAWDTLTACRPTDSAHSELQLRMPSTPAVPPLHAWPQAADGQRLSDEFTLSRLIELNAWRGLVATDRDMILALLDALMDGGPTRDPALRDCVQDLRRQMSQIQRRLRTRHVLGRLAGRRAGAGA